MKDKHGLRVIKQGISYTLMMLLTALLVSGCGSKRSPTGGEQDTVKPVVLASSPAEFGDISAGVIEVSFSKPMDKNSLANSIYIYPPVLQKKFTLDKATLKIVLQEPLIADTNYFVTLSTRLKDTRGNALEKNQTLVFAHGKLADNRIAGTIVYEDAADKGLPVELNLFSADSLLVYAGNVTGGAYAIDNLNPKMHILRSFIDKNQNGRYDFGTEPFFEGLSDGSRLANVNISMAYADTTKVRVSRVNVVSNREIQVLFSEPVKSYGSVELEGTQALEIEHLVLEKDRLCILTTAMDSTQYTLKISAVSDPKGNVSELLQSKFTGTAQPDTSPLQISHSVPRNGASVNILQPVIEIHFNKIVPGKNILVRLSDGNTEIPVQLLSSTGRLHRYKPTKDLVNYRSHTFTVFAASKDHSGKTMESDYILQFLPLKR